MTKEEIEKKMYELQKEYEKLDEELTQINSEYLYEFYNTNAKKLIGKYFKNLTNPDGCSKSNELVFITNITYDKNASRMFIHYNSISMTDNVSVNHTISARCTYNEYAVFDGSASNTKWRLELLKEITKPKEFFKKYQGITKKLCDGFYFFNKSLK